MPKSKVRWTHSADQILLLKIIEAHDLTVDTAKIAASWPSEGEAKPTPRAIKERISKIREMLKSGALGVTDVAATPTSTPKKSRTKSAATSHTTTTSGASKRKRQGKNVSPSSELQFSADDENEEPKSKVAKAEAGETTDEEEEHSSYDPAEDLDELE